MGANIEEEATAPAVEDDCHQDEDDGPAAPEEDILAELAADARVEPNMEDGAIIALEIGINIEDRMGAALEIGIIIEDTIDATLDAGKKLLTIPGADDPGREDEPATIAEEVMAALDPAALETSAPATTRALFVLELAVIRPTVDLR